MILRIKKGVSILQLNVKLHVIQTSQLGYQRRFF